MSGFQRFVSYINLYEGNKKIRNVGFAKIERQQGQCKIEIHLKGTGYTGIACPVYLFARKDERMEGISLGKIQLANGAALGTFHVQAENIVDSGYKMEQVCGFLIFVTEHMMLASEWDDRGILREQFVDVSKEQVEKQKVEEHAYEKHHSVKRNSESIQNSKDIEAITQRVEETMKGNLKSIERKAEKDLQSVGNNIEASIQRAEASTEEKPEVNLQSIKNRAEASYQRAEENTEEKPEDIERKAEANFPSVEEKAKTNLENIKNKAEVNTEVNFQNIEKKEEVSLKRAEKNTKDNMESIQHKTEELRATEAVLQRKEVPKLSWEKKWQFILENYPVMTPFDAENILCVRLELKDLRLLPKCYWHLGNNSFLLHGFFNYRYLILGVVEQGDKKRWFLGVPGIYQSQERVMASLFGFTEYRSEKTAPQKTGQFGYWYRFL